MLAISLTIACSCYIYNGVILHTHPVHGESHNQIHAIPPERLQHYPGLWFCLQRCCKTFCKVSVCNPVNQPLCQCCCKTSQVMSSLRCRPTCSEVKHISIDKAWNKQHGLGERQLKQSLNQSSPAYIQWLSSFNITSEAQNMRWIQIETKTKKHKSVLSLRSTFKNILKIMYCIYHT